MDYIIIIIVVVAVIIITINWKDVIYGSLQ